MDLKTYAEWLAQQRDEALTEATRNADHFNLSHTDKARASSYKLALDALHSHTQGEFGEHYERQPEVWGTSHLDAKAATA